MYVRTELLGSSMNLRKPRLLWSAMMEGRCRGLLRLLLREKIVLRIDREDGVLASECRYLRGGTEEEKSSDWQLQK